MTADQILIWLDFELGTARKSHVRKVWNAFNTTGDTIWIAPAHSCAAILNIGQHYGLERALKSIGCTRKEN